ncbi:MAG: glycosyltransferase [Syntrophothermus sp.]
MNIVIIGLSITSSWGNGHANTYRSFIKGLSRRGHHVLFLEKNVPWYSDNRDLPDPDFCKVGVYQSFEELRKNYVQEVKTADMVIVGSNVHEGILTIQWVQKKARGVKAFYDIDTPVTLSALKKNSCKYLDAELIPGFDLYLSFTAGKMLYILQEVFGANNPHPFYCSVDPALYYPSDQPVKWDLGYIGTYSADRQGPLERLMLDAAKSWDKGRFVVAGPQYPSSIEWPENVERIDHLAPRDHPAFYNQQKYTLNITRRDMIDAGYSPSVRLFEAAACGIPVISDFWEGLFSIFEPGKEIFISGSAADTLSILYNTPEHRRKEVGARARKKILDFHTGDHRALELEEYYYRIKNRNTISLHV